MKFPTRPKDLQKLAVAGGIALLIGGAALTRGQLYRGPDFSKMKVSNERDQLWFETNVGSFKILPRGDVLPSGDLSMAFTGSVLISELNGAVTPVGNVRREYDNKEHGREVWFGTGKLTIKGSFRAVQWFGRNLKANFNGNGFIRLYGEFDKNLDTGLFWFDPAKKQYWGTYGTGVGIPESSTQLSPDNVKTRKEPG